MMFTNVFSVDIWSLIILAQGSIAVHYLCSCFALAAAVQTFALAAVQTHHLVWPPGLCTNLRGTGGRRNQPTPTWRPTRPVWTIGLKVRTASLSAPPVSEVPSPGTAWCAGMMKGKLMKSLFRGKGGVPRTPGGPVVNEGDEVKFESPLTRQLLTKRSKNSHFSNLVIWRMR